MSRLRKFFCLMLSLSIFSYSIPAFAIVNSTTLASEAVMFELTDEQMLQAVGGSGNVDATMSDYVKFDPGIPAVAEAVISNRANISVPYSLDVVDFNTGNVLENLDSGTLAQGETKLVKGTPTIANRSYVRIKIGNPSLGLEAIDSASLQTIR